MGALRSLFLSVWPYTALGVSIYIPESGGRQWLSLSLPDSVLFEFVSQFTTTYRST